ncbi:GYF domain protein [Ceratocystis lukuohia]|uniref:GYF domain protein n=1 Tax=Ceratocystis lukuohia TaxID=2019550 RepID=A0ABR4MPT1_9PEZI
MSSRYTAAKATAKGDIYARTHHSEGAGSDESKKGIRFDVRNPSALAPNATEEEDEEDAFLKADVIRGAASTKRGAVNIDGYDSDSDNETFNAKAQQRTTGDVDINERFDNYSAQPGAGNSAKKRKTGDDDDDDDFDMFGGGDDEEADNDEAQGKENADFHADGKKKKGVRFVDASEIVQGEDGKSRGGGHIHLNDESSDDDEDEKALAAAEEDLDPEIGAGGSKRNAPKLEAFNLKQEQEEGRFDEAGNYVRQAAEAGAEHDKWLDGLSKKDMKKAAEAHERREAEAARLRRKEDEILTEELLATLIRHLERTETPLEALARLGKHTGKTKAKAKKIPAWRLKKMREKDSAAEAPESGTTEDKTVDSGEAQAKAAIDAITNAADKLLSRDHEEIYDEERELLVRQWQRETGHEWVEPVPLAEAQKNETDDADTTDKAVRMWQYRWTDGRDGGAAQGPFDGQTMKAWQDAGYFGEGVEFKPTESDGEWTRLGDFI